MTRLEFAYGTSTCSGQSGTVYELLMFLSSSITIIHTNSSILFTISTCNNVSWMEKRTDNSTRT